VSTLLANEALKVRTVRTWWIVLVAAQLVVLIGVTGKLLDAQSSTGLTDPALPGDAVVHVGLTSMLLLILGITAVAGEYRHHTIVDTYLATPHRGRVVQAKLVVYTLLGVLFGILGCATALIELAIWMAARGASLDLANGALWRTAVGSIVWDALFAAIGVGVGALIRNLAGAIAAALAWLALVEGVVGELVGREVSRWFPMSLGARLGGVPDTALGNTAPWLAGVALAGYTVAIALAARGTSVRRDVA
jgi:ABC-2 type transport system permease protein